MVYKPLMAALVAALLAAPGRGPDTERVRHIQYADLPVEIQKRLAGDGISRERFPEYLRSVEADTERRVADGERDHLIYFALQSSGFTTRQPIEPAESARRFVDGLNQDDRRRLLEDAAYVPPRGWPAAERARVADMLAALNTTPADARLEYFRPLLRSGEAPLSPDALYADYVRVARFLYNKEFASAGNSAAVAALYQTRSHSSDTQIEAGFGVYLGLGTLHALAPDERVRRVLVVGPGLDFAPRTDLIDVVPPQVYQPFAVADALLALSISSEADLHVHSVDVNSRVVGFAEHSAREPVTLHLFTGVAETREQPFSADYRSYVHALGRAIGNVVTAPAPAASDRRYQHSIGVREPIRRAMSAERLNVITERLVEANSFDLVVITNVLTYFDDRQLALALSNMAGMLRPGGYLLHNESRAGLVETAAVLQVPAVHMRTAVIAGSGPRPLYDTVWLHQKAKRQM